MGNLKENISLMISLSIFIFLESLSNFIKFQQKIIENLKIFVEILHTILGPLTMSKIFYNLSAIIKTIDSVHLIKEISCNQVLKKIFFQSLESQLKFIGDGKKSILLYTGEFLQMSKEFMCKNVYPLKISNMLKINPIRFCKYSNEASNTTFLEDKLKIQRNIMFMSKSNSTKKNCIFLTSIFLKVVSIIRFT